jgi:hypothetical protein
MDLKKLILDGTEYVSGYNNTEDKYVLSASMIAREPLQNYLTIINGRAPQLEIDDTSLGNCFHLGMEQIVNKAISTDEYRDTIVGSEMSFHTELPNGWIISGSADLVTKDGDNYSIHDYKLSKMYAKRMMIKEIHTHAYTTQLQVLDFLFREDSGRPEVIDGEINLLCEFFVKDAKAINKEPTYERIVCPNIQGTEDMNARDIMKTKLTEITDSLQSYIESGTIPPKCSDTWPRNVKGKVISTKCALYCDHGKSNQCPYYQATTMQEANRIANW